MKYLYFLFLLLFFYFHSIGQCPVSDTISRNSVPEIKKDIDRMYAQMDTLNSRYFYPLIKAFNTINDTVNNTVANRSIDSIILSTIHFIDSIKPLIDSQYFDRYIVNDTVRYKKACFYYSMHKEIEDYINSIDLLEKNMGNLVVRGLIGTIAKVRFLNSYYYMSTCRSLLLARVNNLENEMVLLRPYEPYPGKKVLFMEMRTDPRQFKNRDENKIPSATDEIIKETRQGPRNWFLKSMGGSAAGGLIAYAIIVLIRGHK